MDQVITTAIISAATSILFSNGAKAPVNTLDLLWRFTLGRWDRDMEKYLQKRDNNLNKYVEDIAEEVSRIPDNELRDEPDISIMGPALEASKYYIDNEVPRKMFAKLIAASMDKRKEGMVHPAFVDVIRQMSPNDALLLSELENPTSLFVCQIKLKGNTGQAQIIYDIYISRNHPNFNRENCLSISNLERLGFLDIPTRNLSSMLVDGDIDMQIERFKKTDLYSEILDDCNNPASPREKLDIYEYKAYLTEFAFAFIKTCLR